MTLINTENGDIYAVENILELEKRIAEYKKYWRGVTGKRINKYDCMVIYFTAEERPNGDILLDIEKVN